MRQQLKPSLAGRRGALCALLLFMLAAQARTQAAPISLPTAEPAAVGMSAERLLMIDRAVLEALDQKRAPGVVVLVARRGHVVWRKAYGARALMPTREAMTEDTVFDVASLTKVVATATSVMILVERGQLRLNDSVSQHIPELKGGGRERVTIEHLLTHRSGYAPDFDLAEKWEGHDEMLKRLYTEPLRAAPGSRFVYSDIGLIALGEVVRRVSGMPLDEFARKNIYQPLGMRETMFTPPGSLRARIAPTETVRGSRSYLGGSGDPSPGGARMLRGEVHDPTANRMRGVAGHAGLFSTADDLAVYAQMILNLGEYNGTRVLSPYGVAEMTRPRQVSEEGWARGLGWDVNTDFSGNRGDIFPIGSFGHTGFTGTSVWIDPASETFVVFLSNRVHPDGKGDIGMLRGRVASIVAGAITEPEAAARGREAHEKYLQQMLAGLKKFQASVDEARQLEASGLLASPASEVLTGIDVLARDEFRQLRGMKIGLVTNHTGRDRKGRPTIDVLRDAPSSANVQLVALFSPEHGIRGQLDDKVSDAVDEKTGLPIYSLYGDSRRPRQENLRGLDAVVFDIQDIGTRFYTYISTLGYLMEEAAKLKIPVFVLDRPNPINGFGVEGPVADEDKLSFTSYHQLPVRHGMTVGELAQLFNTQRKINCDLRVVRMENWSRGMWYDATGLTWVNPSPNMRSLTQATLYPGVGLLETTNLSVGRGTDTPFELIGAPWLDGQALAAYLNRRNVAGLRFVPVRFTPRSSVFKGEDCGGVNLVVTNRAVLSPVRAGLEIAAAIRRQHPDDWKADGYLRLLADADTHERLLRGEPPDEITRSWQPALEEFRRARTRALIYR